MSSLGKAYIAVPGNFLSKFASGPRSFLSQWLLLSQKHISNFLVMFLVKLPGIFRTRPGFGYVILIFMLAKPTVPARPTGSKISALQAGFMNDLNKKLGLGPVAPKKEESREEPQAEEEKAPLADARKGRAKGPQRRKPGVSPSGAAEEEKKVSKPAAVRFAISRPMTIWDVDESGELSMGSTSVEAPKVEEPAKVASDETAASSSSKKTTTTGTDMAVQTGELDISMMTDTATGEHEEKTVYLGGRAPEPGSVVVDADGTQHIGSPDSLGSIEKIGLGM
jgi:hypothetical protein